METTFDLFGEKVEQNAILREVFLENPFSVLDTKGGGWQNRKRKWRELGIRSEVGRDLSGSNAAFRTAKYNFGKMKNSDTSIFDPALCELMYRWFCPMGGGVH